MTDEEKLANKFFKCPKGHALPRITPSGECTTIFCTDNKESAVKRAETHLSAERRRKREKRVKAGEEVVTADASVTAVVPAELREEVQIYKDEQMRLAAKPAARLAMRRSILKTPELSGADAEDWADKKIVELLPAAVAEVEWLMKFGDDNQRERNAHKILDANGRGKREAVSNATAPIVILTGSAVMNPPWRQANATVIDAREVQKPALPAPTLPPTTEVTDAEE